MNTDPVPSMKPTPEMQASFANLFAERLDPMQKEAPYTALHLRWFLNISSFIGNQRLSVDPRTQEPTGTDSPTWRSRYIANLIFPKVQRALSKLAGEDSAARCSPASVDHDDVVKARNAEAMLDYMRDVSGFSEERSMAVLWSICTGTGPMKIWFDPSAGESREVRDEQGLTIDRVRVGEARVCAASPFGLRLPVYSDREDEIPWVAWNSYRDLDSMRARFPWAAGAIQQIEPASDLDWTSELRLRTLMASGSVVSEPSRERICRVTELHVRPTHGLPNGAHGIKINDVPVFVSVDPKKPGEHYNPFIETDTPIPFVFYRYAKVPGRFWGLSLVEMLDQIQREYNQTRGDIVENIRLTARPKILSPKGGLTSRSSWTSMPGEVVEYNASLPKPEMVTPPALPAYVEEHVNRCQGEMNDVSGQAEVSEGKTPASVRSGVAIQLLQTAAMETLGHARKLIVTADRDVYRALLRNAKRFYKEDRTIAILGKSREFEVLRLSGQDLASPESVRVFAESGLFESKAARVQTILDAVQLGMFNMSDPFERLGLITAVEMGDVAPWLAEMTTDQRNADEENAAFEALADPKLALQPQARDFEDHVVHIRRHNLFRKRDTYRALPSEAQALVDAHVAAHQNFLATQIAAQQQGDQAAKGQPKEKGQPSPPGSGKSGQAADGGGANAS